MTARVRLRVLRVWMFLALLALLAVPLPAAAQVPPIAVVGIVNTPLGYRFAPATIVVPVGATVSWQTLPLDDQPHNVRSQAPGGPRSSTLQAGQSFSFTFSRAGTYDYRCTFHGNQGQVGQIVVSNNRAVQSSSGVQLILQGFSASMTPAAR